MGLRFTSVLDKGYREDLTELLFFHPQQERYASSLITSIELYGTPAVFERDSNLRIDIPRIQGVQTLYALIDDMETPELAGVVAYARISPDELAVLHIAVKEKYTFPRVFQDELVTVQLLERLWRIAHQIKGIRNVRLDYSRMGKTKLQVKA